MKLLNSFKNKCRLVDSASFDGVALDLFRYQAEACPVYANYLDHLGTNIAAIRHIEEIPCLPIDFFKHHKVKTDIWDEEEVFMSSGTTASIRSRHYMEDAAYYLENCKQIFEAWGQKLSDVMVFALLPSYQEQGHSSLVRMVEYFIQQSNSNEGGGFYLDKIDKLLNDLQSALQSSGKRVILFGVGYALLDMAVMARDRRMNFDGLTLIETGGMKGRRKDMVKEEFYDELQSALGQVNIYSEYGMTELLSQAYATSVNRYQLPAQMKIMIRDGEDPFSYLGIGKSGGINVLDLANVHSCAFIETKDLGRLLSREEFEILGRLDNSDIRGCNLMMD